MTKLKELESVMALLLFEDPSTSSLGHLMSPMQRYCICVGSDRDSSAQLVSAFRRSKMAAELNEAILVKQCQTRGTRHLFRVVSF